MSDLITTVYPTAGITNKADRTPLIQGIQAMFAAQSSITDFFTVTYKLSDDTNCGATLTRKSTSKVWLLYSPLTTLNPCFKLQNSDTYVSPEASNLRVTDIPVRFATGINGTNAMWLDDYSKGCVLVYGTHGGLDLVMSSASADDISFYIANTDASTAKGLPMPCNGDLIGTGTPYVCQPYFWNGINTEDIYTFDCGSDSIPFGEFWIGDKHFVSLYSNFALRLE